MAMMMMGCGRRAVENGVHDERAVVAGRRLVRVADRGRQGRVHGLRHQSQHDGQ